MSMSKYQKYLDEMTENSYCMNCDRQKWCEDKTCCQYAAPHNLQILINRSENCSDDFIVKRNVELINENRKLKKVIEFLTSHMHLASGLCEIKLADKEVSELHAKYHNGKEVYEPNYNEFYTLMKEVIKNG